MRAPRTGASRSHPVEIDTGRLWLSAARLFATATGALASSAEAPRAEAEARPTVAQVVKAAKTAPAAEARRLRDRAALDAESRRFVDALIAANEGDLAEAERELRALLAEDPSRRLVRFELAQVLIRRERYTAARFHLQRLVDSENDPQLRAVYGVFDREISRRRPWGVTLSIDAAPRTNVNRGSGELFYDANGTLFAIDEDARARSGIGVRFATSATRRFEWSPFADAGSADAGSGAPTDAFHLRAFASGTLYRDSSLSTTRVGAGGFWRRRFAGGSLFDLGVDYARDHVSGTVFDGDVHADLVTPNVAFATPLGRRFTLATSARASHVFHADGDLADGWRGTGSLALTWSPQPGRAVTGSVARSFERSGREHARYDGTTLGLGFYAELPWSVSATLDGSVGRRDYRAPFPGNVFAREDRFWRVGLRFTKRDWALAGFAPRIGVSYERQRSNISFYTFDDAGITLGLSRSF